VYKPAWLRRYSDKSEKQGYRKIHEFLTVMGIIKRCYSVLISEFYRLIEFEYHDICEDCSEEAAALEQLCCTQRAPACATRAHKLFPIELCIQWKRIDGGAVWVETKEFFSFPAAAAAFSSRRACAAAFKKMASQSESIKFIPGTNFIVDGFRIKGTARGGGKKTAATAADAAGAAAEPKRIYFLTHFHSDHYCGITSRWNHGVIYCSEATANLCKKKFKVSDDFLRPLDGTYVCVLYAVIFSAPFVSAS
jgi:hypothetical protein